MLSVDARILQTLRLARAHLRLEEIASIARVSAAEVPQAIQRLGEAEFQIKQDHLGYRLIAAPDRLLADDLAGRLEGCPLVRQIVVFASTTSTSDVAARLGREGAASGLVIVAERQTAGRGRFGRVWDSPAGAGIWLSLILRPALPIEKWHRLTLCAALAVREALQQETQVDAGLKWPNDLWVHGRKIAGVLMESFTDHAGDRFAVLGIGINVHQEHFPEEIQVSATSIRQITGKPFPRAPIAAALLWSLSTMMADVETSFASLIGRAERWSVLLGREIVAGTGSETHAGIAESLDEEGFLRLRSSTGNVVTLRSGEVSVRPVA